MAVRLCLFAVGPDEQVLHLSYARYRRLQLGQEPFRAAGHAFCLIVALIDPEGKSPRILKQAFVKYGLDSKGFLKTCPDLPSPIPPNIGTRDADKFFEALRRFPDRWTPSREHLLQIALRAKRCAPPRAGRPRLARPVATRP